ncbi:uncharacterized protein LOC141592397 isoform X2 [Silene latifolia]|uniref:uncharacterized protein LOC141592397 isoform X2 n=1 Tax=Silene latifolia TaxID=37657 RepID=UPI003D78A247
MQMVPNNIQIPVVADDEDKQMRGAIISVLEPHVTPEIMVDGMNSKRGNTHNLVVPPTTPDNMVHDEKYSRIQSKRRKPSNIDGLVEELLVEILCRLPCHKSAFICKALCKHWAALISHPFFISRYIAYNVSKHSTLCAYKNGLSNYDEVRMKKMNDRKVGLVVRKFGVRDTWKGLMIYFNDPIHNPNNLSLYSLPRLTNGGLPRNLTIVGACHDLFLYQKHAGDPDYVKHKLQLYISNAQTKQWLALPTLPLSSHGPVGLICDPYYFTHKGNVTLNNAYNTCIVVISSNTQEFVTNYPAHLLSPNTKVFWRDVVLLLPMRCRLLAFCRLFCIGRKLCFQCQDGLPPSVLHGYAGRLISFDPFADNDVINCSALILPPSLMNNASFDVFHERLFTCDCDDDGSYRIWVLDDYKTGKWSLLHNIKAQDWIPRDHRLAKHVNQNSYFGAPISFHHVVPDVIYVLCDRWIVLCNFSTREMEVISKLPKGCKSIFPVAYSYQITLPFWPTPLPTFLPDGKDEAS